MEYTHPEALVSTEWLADNLNADGVRIVDASYFLPSDKRDARTEYATKHIPGAVFFNIDDICLDGSDLPHMLPDEETFSAKVGALGIGDGDKVVVYDPTGGGMAAARCAAAEPTAAACATSISAPASRVFVASHN